MKTRRFPAPFNDYFLLKNSRPKPSVMVTEQEIAMSDAAQDELPVLLGEGNNHWILGGGMSIGIHAGAQYRTHYDLDILVEGHEFGSLIASAERKGYQLCRRVFSRRIASNLTIQLVRAVDAYQASRSGYGRLELINLAQAGSPTCDLMNVIDVCVYYRENGEITRHDGRISLPEAEFDDIPHLTKSGRVINVVSLEYLKAVKSRRHGSIDRLDLRMIEELQNRILEAESVGTKQSTV